MTFEVLQTEFTISALRFWTDQTAYYPSRLAAHILKYWYWGEHLSDSNTYTYLFHRRGPLKTLSLRVVMNVIQNAAVMEFWKTPESSCVTWKLTQTISFELRTHSHSQAK